MKNAAPKIFVLLCLISLTVVLYLRTSRSWEQPESRGGTPGAGASAPGQGMPQGQGPALEAFFEELATLEQALEANPEDTVALGRMGKMMMDSHQPEQAVEYFWRYVELVPDSQEAQLKLANAYASQARWRDALTLLEGFVERWPDNYVALFNLGAVHANLGEPDEARALWERVRDAARDSVVVQMAAEALETLR